MKKTRLQEEFEATFVEEMKSWLIALDAPAELAEKILRDQVLERNAQGEYVNVIPRERFNGWKSARAHMTLKLPLIEAWDNDGSLGRERDDDAETAMALIPVIDVQIALRAIGVEAVR